MHHLRNPGPSIFDKNVQRWLREGERKSFLALPLLSLSTGGNIDGNLFAKEGRNAAP
jgi:hypothetical protein